MTKKYFKKLLTILVVISILSTLFSLLFSVCAYSLAPGLISGEIYYIKNKNSGLYLDVDHGIDEDDRNVLQWPLNGGNNQKWQLIDTGNGLYKLISLCSSSGRVLDIYPGDDTQGGNIDIYSDLGWDDMRFSIIRNTDGYSYRIMSQCSYFTKGATVKMRLV